MMCITFAPPTGPPRHSDSRKIHLALALSEVVIDLRIEPEAVSGVERRRSASVEVARSRCRGFIRNIPEHMVGVCPTARYGSGKGRPR